MGELRARRRALHGRVDAIRHDDRDPRAAALVIAHLELAQCAVKLFEARARVRESDATRARAAGSEAGPVVTHGDAQRVLDARGADFERAGSAAAPEPMA